MDKIVEEKSKIHSDNQRLISVVQALKDQKQEYGRQVETANSQLAAITKNEMTLQNELKNKIEMIARLNEEIKKHKLQVFKKQKQKIKKLFNISMI